jgi:hypothetical protein
MPKLKDIGSYDPEYDVRRRPVICVAQLYKIQNDFIELKFLE